MEFFLHGWRSHWRAACISCGAALILLASALALRAGEAAWELALFPSGAAFRLEIAADPAARQRGYMFREHVAPAEGMLFVFERADFHSFWMKNCRVPLDIIWLDEQFRVVHIAAEQPPCPSAGPCRNILPMRAARYVLEVAAGSARREGLRLGDALVLLPEPRRS
jgi:uncharacterized membrane protein (UPF0127 family)